jgi:hypothetical protein
MASAASEIGDGFHGPRNRLTLIGHFMGWHLYPAMTHEFPTSIARSTRHTRIGFNYTGVDGKRRANGVLFKHLKKAPKTNAHPIFMPSPIRQIRLQDSGCRRHQYLTRHGVFDQPIFEIHDRTKDQLLPTGQGMLGPIRRRGIAQPFNRGSHAAFFP